MMKKLRRKRSGSLDAGRPAISAPLPAPAAPGPPSSTSSVPPLYARFAKTTDGAFGEQDAGRRGDSSAGRPAGSSSRGERSRRESLTGGARREGAGAGSASAAGSSHTQVRTVHRKPVGQFLPASPGESGHYKTSGKPHAHKHAASWDSAGYAQPGSFAAGAAADDARRHRTGPSASLDAHAYPAASTSRSAHAQPPYNTGHTQLPPSYPQHQQRPSQDNAQPGPGPSAPRHETQLRALADILGSPSMLPGLSASVEDSRYNVDAFTQPPPPPLSADSHTHSRQAHSVDIPSSHLPSSAREARHAGPPPTSGNTKHRDRKSSQTRQGHVLPTPPPSSASSMSPMTVSSFMSPVSQPAEMPRPQATPSETPGQSRSLGRSSSVHSGQAPRRKYSLLAAFGGGAVKSKTPSASSHAASQVDKQPPASKPPSTSGREADTYASDRQAPGPLQRPPAFSPPQSPERREQRVPVPTNPSSTSERSEPSRGRTSASPRTPAKPSVLYTPSSTSAASPAEARYRPEQGPSSSRPAAVYDSPPLLPPKPKTPTVPALGGLPDLAGFSPFMRESALAQFTNEALPRMSQKDLPPVMLPNATQDLPPRTPPKPEKYLPPQSPPEPPQHLHNSADYGGRVPAVPTVPSVPDSASQSSTASAAASSSSHGPLRGKPLIFAAMAATETEDGGIELRPDLSFDAAQMPAATATLNQAHVQDTSFGHSYPTPRSPSPPLPDVSRQEELAYPPETPKAESSKTARLFGWLRNRSKSRDEERLPVEAVKRSGRESPAVDERGRTKLIKNRLRRRANSDQSQTSAMSVQASFNSARVDVPAASGVDSSGAPLHPNSSMPQLGSHAQVQRNGSVSSLESTNSVQADARGKTGPGVKILTRRQVEKLQSRVQNSVSPSSETRSPDSAGSPMPTATPAQEYAEARTERRGKRLHKGRPPGYERIAEPRPPAPQPAPQPAEPEEPPAPTRPPTYYPLARHVVEPELLSGLLQHLSFYEWSTVAQVSKEIRRKVESNKELTERVLVRYLRTVGYQRWWFETQEPLRLTLQDLYSYMRGVSMPGHQYSRHAIRYLQSKDPAHEDLIRDLAASCRSFTRLVLRVRAQAEAEVAYNIKMGISDSASPERVGRGMPASRAPSSVSAPHSRVGSQSRQTSRGLSPASSFSHAPGYAPSTSGQSTAGRGFHSPLYRPRRAPLLQVFVPSPEGEWLSDASVMECENELKRAGVVHLMRPGDVVWDTAAGDEGNVGRLLWDGTYLIDLDYTYSRMGELPRYLPTLAFPPSYFHRVIRTAVGADPICHIDISPWGREIAMNMQLIQSRVRTETPQGKTHVVVNWSHHSHFVVEPPPANKLIRLRVPDGVPPGPARGAWVIDPAWYGTVVVEAEATGEGLADLQARCGDAFPFRTPATVNGQKPPHGQPLHVFKIIREKSRPGEIWIRTVREKERLLPQ